MAGTRAQNTLRARWAWVRIGLLLVFLAGLGLGAVGLLGTVAAIRDPHWTPFGSTASLRDADPILGPIPQMILAIAAFVCGAVEIIGACMCLAAPRVSRTRWPLAVSVLTGAVSFFLMLLPSFLFDPNSRSSLAEVLRTSLLLSTLAATLVGISQAAWLLFLQRVAIFFGALRTAMASWLGVGIAAVYAIIKVTYFLVILLNPPSTLQELRGPSILLSGLGLAFLGYQVLIILLVQGAIDHACKITEPARLPDV